MLIIHGLTLMQSQQWSLRILKESLASEQLRGVEREEKNTLFSTASSSLLAVFLTNT